MKILLSAYACEPNKGSEPGIGWHWVEELANRGHEVWVLTRAIHRASIEKADTHRRPNVHFLYYDLPRVFSWKSFRKFWPFNAGIQLYWHIWHYPYHFFWQYGAYKKCRTLHAKQKFEIVHHVTFATLRRTCFLGHLDTTFILGPVGGGERTPTSLSRFFSPYQRLLEFVRHISILITKHNPLIKRMFKEATIIYVSTPDSLALVPSCYHYKTHLKLQLGISPPECLIEPGAISHPLRFLYVGRFIYWKGMSFGLRAFAKLLEQFPDAQLTMVGSGPEQESWLDLIKELNIEERVEIVSWVEQSKLGEIFRSHDILLFPSCHDSGALVVVEAMANGLAVICFDLGGPATSVTKTCGIKIETHNKSPEEAIDALAEALVNLYTDIPTLSSLQEGALKRSKEFYWPNVVEDIYSNVTNSDSL